MKKYACLLFDLDGTLTYSHPGIFACIRYALERMGRALPTEQILRACVGPSLLYSFENIFKMNEEDAKEATAIYRERYARIGWSENAPIEGAKEMLEALKEAGYTLAVATGKPNLFADKIVEKFGFSPYLSTVVGCGIEEGVLPTKADVIGEVVRRLGVRKENCLMIGDRKHDIEGARLVEMDSAGVDVGYAEEGELQAENPTYYFKTLEELKAFLLGG